MADTRLFKILFTVHKTDEEDTLAKDYFRTRIWENIELESSSLDEICLYIEKKLVFHNLHSYFDMYNINHIKLIYKLTNGNLRVLNKLLYKIYEIYEYYEESRPSTIKNRRLLKKSSGNGCHRLGTYKCLILMKYKKWKTNGKNITEIEIKNYICYLLRYLYA